MEERWATGVCYWFVARLVVITVWLSVPSDIGLRLGWLEVMDSSHLLDGFCRGLIVHNMTLKRWQTGIWRVFVG